MQIAGLRADHLKVLLLLQFDRGMIDVPGAPEFIVGKKFRHCEIDEDYLWMREGVVVRIYRKIVSEGDDAVDKYIAKHRRRY